jgi:hypothetical protein
MIEIIVFGLLFSLVWFGLGFIGAGYMFAYFTKIHTKGMLQLNKQTGLEWYKKDCENFVTDIFMGFIHFLVVLTCNYDSEGWMFPWSKKTKEYLGIE